MSSTRPHKMVNFGPLAPEIGSLVSGTPANFNGFCVLASLLQRRRSTEVNQSLDGVWSSPALVYYIYIFGGSCPVAAITRSTEVSQTLYDVWPSPGLIHYVYIFGSSCPDGILPPAKFTLLPSSLAFSYIGSITTRHSSSGRQPNFAAWYKEWNHRGRYLYSAGRPSRCALDHISSSFWLRAVE